MERLIKMKATADKMAIRDNREYVVVDLVGDYQIWTKAMMDKSDRDYVYATGGSDGWDDLLS